MSQDDAFALYQAVIAQLFGAFAVVLLMRLIGEEAAKNPPNSTNVALLIGLAVIAGIWLAGWLTRYVWVIRSMKSRRNRL